MQGIRKRGLIDKVSTRTLLIAGYFGVLFSVVSLLVQLIKFLATIVPMLSFLNFTYDSSNLVLPTVSALLLIVSLLTVGIGLERGVIFEAMREEAQQRHLEVLQAISRIQSTVEQDNLSLEKEITEAHQTLTTAITVKPLVGHEAVYEEAARLVKACRGSEIIRSTSVGLDEHAGMAAYRKYLEVLAKVVGQGKRNKLGMVHKVVMGFRLNEKGEPPIADQVTVRNRRELFRANNVLDRLEIKCLENFWNLNLLIVGNEHIIIGFPTRAGDRGTRFGIRISDKDIVESVIRWYDEHLWNNANYMRWTGEETQQ